MALPVRRSEDRGVAAWDPFAQMEQTARQMSTLFDQVMRPWGEVASTAGAAFLPLADLEESDDAFTVEVELPGVDKDDVNIEVSGRRVTVSGERKERERKGVLRRRTRSVGQFFHEVVLPGDVNEDDVTAALNDGVLTVRLPKAETARRRRVEITG